MYTLMIVDDEMAIREGMMGYDWPQWGFSAVACAASGRKALEIMAQTPIDLVITDIKMPVMDGLELSKQIRKLYPECLIIILTGYKEFEYAQTALQAGVFDYLLKPVDMRKYDGLFRRAAEYLNMRRQNLSILNHAVPIATEKVLTDILDGRLSTYAQIEDASEYLNMPLSALSYCVIALRMLSGDAFSKERRDQLLEKLRQLRADDPASFVYAVWRDECFVVMCCLNTEKPMALPYALGECVLKLGMEVLPGRVFTVGIGSVVYSPLMISICYEQAKLLTERARYLNEVGKVAQWTDIKGTAGTYPHDMEETLLGAVAVADVEVCGVLLEAYLRALLLYSYERSTPSYDLLVASFMEKVEQVIRPLRVTFRDFDSTVDFFTFVQGYETFPALLIALNERLKQVLEAIAQRQQAVYPTAYTAVKQATRYILNNYDKKITLAMMAERVYLNVSYFSVLFKKETGKNFIDFLTEVRMERAKELLATTHKRIFEIGWQVGYQNQRYFTESFRKYTGTSPREFRQLAQNGKGM